MHIKGHGRYPLGKATNWDFNLDGMSRSYRIKGYWKRHFNKLQRRKNNNLVPEE